MISKQTQNKQNNWAADPKCVLLLHCDGENNGTVFTDSSKYAKTVTRFGDAKTVTATKRFGSASAYLDGTGDYLRINDSTIPFGTNDFTISFWLWETVMTPNYPTPFQFSTAGTYETKTTKLELRANTTTVLLYSANGLYTSITFTRTQGQWNHWAIIKSGSVYTLYYNGVSVGTRTDTTSETATYLSIGGDASYFFTGNIDDFIYINGLAVNINDLYPQRSPLYDYALSEPAGV